MRRKFVEALKFEPACQQVLELIGQLYAIEEELPDWHALGDTAQQEALAHRRAVRQQQSAPLTERIQAWALSQRALPDSTFRKALEYMLELLSGLTVFLRNPRVPLDSRVEDRRGGVQAALGCIRRFRLRARVERAITPSPAPASSNRTGGFPASGSPRRRHLIGVMIPFGRAPAFAAV